MLFFITRKEKGPIISKDGNVPVEPTGSTSRTAQLEVGWEIEDFSKKDLAVTTLSAQLCTVCKESNYILLCYRVKAGDGIYSCFVDTPFLSVSKSREYCIRHPKAFYDVFLSLSYFGN